MTTSVLQDMIAERTGQSTFGAEAPSTSTSPIPAVATAGLMLGMVYLAGREFAQDAKRRGEGIEAGRETSRRTAEWQRANKPELFR